jgi:hypothetical protein
MIYSSLTTGLFGMSRKQRQVTPQGLNMECKSCEAVVAYKDTKGQFHDTLEKCQEANREYKRQEAKKKFVDHLVKHSYYWQLAYREHPYVKHSYEL